MIKLFSIFGDQECSRLCLFPAEGTPQLIYSRVTERLKWYSMESFKMMVACVCVCVTYRETQRNIEIPLWKDIQIDVSRSE